MARQVTKWKPDTCGCTLFYEWDSEAKDTERVHTAVGQSADGSEKVFRCERHKDIEDVDKLYETVLEENRAKNLEVSE